MRGEVYWRALVTGELRGFVDRLLLLLLMFLSFPYAVLLRLRAWGYASGILRSYRLNSPVISVGNITVGGTGKTPMTAHIARLLMAQGRRVAVLSRGHGGSYGGLPRVVSDGVSLFMTAQEAGDEPYLLARDLPGLMVVIGHDRYEAGRMAEQELNPDVFILDDGFQHLRLRRNLNVLLLDGRCPFGNGLTLPAGLLREPTTAVRRADLVILTRCDDGSARPTEVQMGVPVLSARHRLSGIVPLEGGECRPFSALYGEKVLAFAGIADPDRFFSGVAETGVEVVGSLSLPDHTVYDDRALAGIRQLFRSTGATCVLTTAKDAVKLDQRRKELGRVWVAQLEMILEDPTALREMVESLFHGTGKSL